MEQNTPTISSENVNNENKNNSQIDEEQYELYDRNIRLWGKENQLKLSNSHVLLINLNCTITELAKNLLLAGINLYLYDKDKNGVKRKVYNNDINCNYFLNKSHLNLNRVDVLLQGLQSINQFTSVNELDSLEKLQGVQCACVGFSSFENLSYYEEYFSKRNIPFYCINTSGMYAFFYNNLTLIQNNNSNFNSNENNSNIKSSPQKRTKLLSPNFTKQIDAYLDNLKNTKSTNKKKLLKNSLYISICLLQVYYRRAIPGELNQHFQKKLLFIENYLKENNLDFLSDSEEFQAILKKLIKNFNNEFNPICSIIAGIVSQEVLKVLTNSGDAFTSLYTFDSEQESGNFLNLLSI